MDRKELEVMGTKVETRRSGTNGVQAAIDRVNASSDYTQVHIPLRQLRKYHRLSQSDVADLIGMSRATVANVELGRHAHIGTITQMFAVLGVTVSFTATRREEERNE
jgi:DNA-binding XRE family transcriptional regulator